MATVQGSGRTLERESLVGQTRNPLVFLRGSRTPVEHDMPRPGALFAALSACRAAPRNGAEHGLWKHAVPHSLAAYVRHSRWLTEGISGSLLHLPCEGVVGDLRRNIVDLDPC